MRLGCVDATLMARHDNVLCWRWLQGLWSVIFSRQRSAQLLLLKPGIMVVQHKRLVIRKGRGALLSTSHLLCSALRD